jgi:hypothetical protein
VWCLGVEHPCARGHPAWVWVWVWVWVWAPRAYKAGTTYLTQPSSEGGRTGVGEDVEEVGAKEWVLSGCQRRRVNEA